MALSRDKKVQVLDELSSLFETSKLTVVAKYEGTTVKEIQDLRRQAKVGGTKIKVVKNRLIIKALQNNETLKDVDTSELKGMLTYAFNEVDEVAPAQVLNNFKKSNPTISFVGAITADGKFISADDVQALANLPSKDQLRGMLVGTIAAPLTGFMNILNGNLRGVLNVLNARSESIN